MAPTPSGTVKVSVPAVAYVQVGGEAVKVPPEPQGEDAAAGSAAAKGTRTAASRPVALSTIAVFDVDMRVRGVAREVERGVKRRFMGSDAASPGPLRDARGGMG